LQSCKLLRGPANPSRRLAGEAAGAQAVVTPCKSLLQTRGTDSQPAAPIRGAQNRFAAPRN